MPASGLCEALGNRTRLRIETEIPLGQHTSFGIGGPAALFATATSADTLAVLLKGARALDLPVLIVGGGTNLLVSDDGFDGLAIRLALETLVVDPVQSEIRVEAGVPTAELVETAIAHNLGGLAFAAGLPGTVGGALAGNAGCFGQCLSDPLKEATLVARDGAIVRVADPGWFAFRYRHSKLLETGHVITEAVFRLTPADGQDLRVEAEANLALRREKHPAKGMRTAGSYFKNLPPPGVGERRRAAGLLLDQVGAKGLAVGDAAVFEKHANIIINRGNATARDVLILAAEMQRRVHDAFGVMLVPEVRFVGPRPKGL